MNRGRFAGDPQPPRARSAFAAVKTCPMCRKSPNAARGRDPPWPDRSSPRRYGGVLCVLLLLIGMLLGCEAGGNGTPDVYRILGGSGTRHADYDYPRMSEMDDARQQGDLYIGRSGDPWTSVSSAHNYEKDILVRVPPSANHTNALIPVAFRSAVKETSTRARFKRGVIHLYNMVVCATGCNPLAYKGYGCYCGFLGSGYVIDGIDQYVIHSCCKMHDWCYDATECPMFSEYFVPYYWRCYRGYKPICAVEHGDWGGSGSCAQRLCECDRSLAECLKRYPCPTTKAVCTSSPWRLVQNLFMII
ncbi:uncharacterized protein LOC105181277 isoform X1 [Harpegnathos saltator]|uniref:uncharacterized protein LOC105181277 isoform X1 n=1 Tax=Harpegnathos saltator TaxID=610380 RepID=UPI000DBEDF12|nr:uncharacterized protein LOC105181277 isoform X1 [Harpegnathos saltator]